MICRPTRVECITPEFGKVLSGVILRRSNPFTLAELATKIVREGSRDFRYGEDTYAASLSADYFGTNTDLQSIVAGKIVDDRVLCVSSIAIASPFSARNAVDVSYLPKKINQQVVRLFGEGVAIEERYPCEEALGAPPRIESTEYNLCNVGDLVIAANEARDAALRFFARCSS